MLAVAQEAMQQTLTQHRRVLSQCLYRACEIM